MREDFYYLVSTVTLRISPLRCRRSEILSIADDLLTQYSKQFDRPKPVLREEIIGFLMEHTWPENLSELQTAIKTFVAIGDQSISLAALKAAASTVRSNGERKSLSLKDATRAASAQIERQLISEVLVATGGNRKRAADELGISYKALLYKLKQVGTDTGPLPARMESRYETRKASHFGMLFAKVFLPFPERGIGRRAGPSGRRHAPTAHDSRRGNGFQTAMSSAHPTCLPLRSGRSRPCRATSLSGLTA